MASRDAFDRAAQRPAPDLQRGGARQDAPSPSASPASRSCASSRSSSCDVSGRRRRSSASTRASLGDRPSRIAAPLLEQAEQILRQQSIPAQKAGRFSESDLRVTTGRDADRGRRGTGRPRRIALYKGHREITHLANWVAMLDDRRDGLFVRMLAELSRLAQAGPSGNTGRGDWASVHKDLDRLGELSAQLRPRLLAAAQKKVGPHVCDVGNLDEFPEDRFGWLNARDLMGNDPSLWPFVAGPSSAGCIPLAGRWEFRLDPNNTGASGQWYDGALTDGWARSSCPSRGSGKASNFDNLKSPGDAPYKAPMSGDKPYNGYAWYRKTAPHSRELAGQATRCCGSARSGIGIGCSSTASRWERGLAPARTGGCPPDETVSIAPEAVRFGVENTIVVQVYNHNNFGGIVAGRPALYVEGQEPQFVETPGPLSYACEWSHTGDERPIASYSALASVMSPGVVLRLRSEQSGALGLAGEGIRLARERRLRGQVGPVRRSGSVECGR